MIEKCPECDGKIEILPIQEPSPQSTSTMSLSSTITFNTETYPPTSRTYKCSNPKCWVTKIRLSWE